MSREIKFRAKIRYNGNHRFHNEWVYGYYWYHEIEEKHYIKESEDVDDLGTYEHSDFEIIPETVGQYIGFKDKNEKDIYEGDLLKVRLNKEKIVTDEVYWSDYGWKWKSYALNEVIHEAEIIGNIHEN